MTRLNESHAHVLSIAKANHPSLAELVILNGPIQSEETEAVSLVEFLAATVISQQLSSRASKTIWKRVCELKNREGVKFQFLFSERYQAALANCGISRFKIKAIVTMNRACSVGMIEADRIRAQDYDQIVETITGLWGFGRWSADMVAIFFSRLPDVWPNEDAALRRGLRVLAPGDDPSKVALQYSPHRTYLARHIWKAIDAGVLSS